MSSIDSPDTQFDSKEYKINKLKSLNVKKMLAKVIASLVFVVLYSISLNWLFLLPYWYLYSFFLPMFAIDINSFVLLEWFSISMWLHISLERWS